MVVKQRYLWVRKTLKISDTTFGFNPVFMCHKQTDRNFVAWQKIKIKYNFIKVVVVCKI